MFKVWEKMDEANAYFLSSVGEMRFPTKSK